MLDDQPIYHDLGVQQVPGLEDWDVKIPGREDTARFIATFGPKEEQP